MDKYDHLTKQVFSYDSDHSDTDIRGWVEWGGGFHLQMNLWDPHVCSFFFMHPNKPVILSKLKQVDECIII